MSVRDRLAHQTADIIINYPLIGVRFPGESPIILKQTHPASLSFTVHGDEVSAAQFTLYLLDEMGPFSVKYNIGGLHPPESWDGPIISKEVA